MMINREDKLLGVGGGEGQTSFMEFQPLPKILHSKHLVICSVRVKE